MKQRLSQSFFTRDVLEVAPDLLGKTLVRIFCDGHEESYIITETEAYRGEEDLACHASKGMTPRTQVMYNDGGLVYVYLIYGMYQMLNVVTSHKGNPQAVLIRGLKGFSGPGKLTKQLQINKSFYAENLVTSPRLYITEGISDAKYETSFRIGIDYAGDIWKNKPWRYILQGF